MKTAKQLLILAGGQGTRLKTVCGNLPKPLIPIGEVSLLEHQIRLAKRNGYTSIWLLVYYGADQIQKTLGKGEELGVQLNYYQEKTPLGTAGAVLQLWDHLADEFMVMYGDTMINLDLQRFENYHHQHQADATLFVHPNDHPFDSDLIETDANDRILAFHNRPHSPGIFRQNLVNAALYLIKKKALKPWKKNKKFLDFGKDLFPELLKKEAFLQAYRSPEYIKDIGTPERYQKVCQEYNTKVIEKASLSHLQPAVFLDRDGTLNEDRMEGITHHEQLFLLPTVAEAIQKLNHHGIRTLVITNQPVIAKGFCSETDVQMIHNKLETLLGQNHAFLDRIYFCPHHPEKGFPGERTELKIPCSCRKPNIGMVEQAIEQFHIDRKKSWFIGDTTTDIQTAKNAQIKSILIQTGQAGHDKKYSVKPNFTFGSLLEAVEFIIQQN
ncbi:MAG: HAD-IIIA family hydrolase [Verrucomicrobiae bacterium]|nr:HAD-IIIA family hydrolase [Verrucomicrobiae bacterium]